MKLDHLSYAELEALEERFLKTSVAMCLARNEAASREALLLADEVLMERYRRGGR